MKNNIVYVVEDYNGLGCEVVGVYDNIELAIENAINSIHWGEIDPEEYGYTGNEDDFEEKISDCLYIEFRDMINNPDLSCDIYNVFIEKRVINKTIDR